MAKVQIGEHWYTVEQLTALAEKEFNRHSRLIGIEVEVTGLVLEGNEVVRYPLGKSSAAPRRFRTGSRGFFINARVPDPSDEGMEANTTMMVGINVVGSGSQGW